MNKQCIITKEAGHDVPKGFLQVALKECPTYHGITIQDKDGDTPLLETAAHNKTIALDDLCKTLAGLKDVRAVVQLGSMTQDFDPETDMMPFVFQVAGAGEDDPPTDILAVHIEGDFPNYCKPGGGHTDEFNLWENFLFPTMMEKFEASEDVDNFFERLRSSQWDQAITNTIGHRGVAVFVPLHGDVIACGRNEIGGKFDWGTTSNAFNWGTQKGLDKAVETAVSTVKKVGGRLAQAMGSTAVATNVTPAAPIKTDDKGVHHLPDDKNDPFKRWEGASNKTHQMMSIPTGLQGNARNAWIRLFLGLDPNAPMPKGHDQRNFMIPIRLEDVGFAQENVSTKDSVKQLGSRVASFRQGNAAGSQDAPAVNEPKPTVAPPHPKETQRPPADFLPELSAADKLGAVSLVTEWATNPKAPTAAEVQRIEAKYPKFSTIMGIRFENMANWSIADIKFLSKKHPDAMALAFVEMRRRTFELGGFEPSLNTEHINDKTDKRVPAKGPAEQVEVPSPQPGVAPAQRKTGRLAKLTAA